MTESKAQIRKFIQKYYTSEYPELTDALADIAIFREYTAGDPVFSPGDEMNEIRVLYSGGVKSVWHPSEEYKPLVMWLVYMPGVPMMPIQFDGASQRTFSTSVIPTVNSSFICFPYDKVLDLVADHSILLRIFITMQQNRISFHAKHSLLLRQFNNNLEGLYDYCTRHHPMLLANSSIEDLASWLGVSMYHLSRVRNKWKRENPEAYEELCKYKV